jgi:hypothetical protein
MRTTGNAIVPGADMAGLLGRHVCCSSERFAAMCDDADLAAGALSACHSFHRYRFSQRQKSLSAHYGACFDSQCAIIHHGNPVGNSSLVSHCCDLP